jgi:2-polyprenyl-3-methyl-5-hydroxy-6-metoxy-1,4-benzoquinol methylase
VKAVTLTRLQNFGIFYNPKFDFSKPDKHQHPLKIEYKSPHSEAANAIQPNTKVLDLGAIEGNLGRWLAQHKGCKVAAVDLHPIANRDHLDFTCQHNLNDGLPQVDYTSYEEVLLLDVLEHLNQPETFLRQLRVALQENPNARILASTGNVGFFIPRFMLLFGQLNYGKRGILDMTHTRLFTFRSFKDLFLNAGYEIQKIDGIPGPFPLAFKNRVLSRILLSLNQIAIKISRGLFSYQIFIIAKPIPTVRHLLSQSIYHSNQRKADLQ